MSFLTVRVGAVVAVLMSIAVPEISAQVPQPDRAAASVPAVRINANGTVSIKADAVAVHALLEALQPVCAMDVRLDPKVAARAVSIEVADLAPGAAVGEVLKASGLDFAMHTRCGTTAQPTLVVVRESGGGPPDIRAAEVDPDDPRVKAVQLPPLPAGPPPEPEKREDPNTPTPVTVLGIQDERRELAPGEITGAQLVERLAPRPKSNSPVIELPFTDENGQPYLQLRPPKSTTMILPFPDANGNLVEVPIPTGPRSQTADFPVVNPRPPAAPDGKATAPGATSPTTARRPGGGSER
jgi:hypothetical protein